MSGYTMARLHRFARDNAAPNVNRWKHQTQEQS